MDAQQQADTDRRGSMERRMDRNQKTDGEQRMKTAVVGCGAISDIYLTNMINRFPILEVTACCAEHMEHAVQKAQKYGIRACTYREILEDKTVELIVNLTPAPAHYDIIREAILAGKHVYTEKTMTVELAHAAELVRLAGEHGVSLCSAPDTFLGASLQTARRAIDEGKLGEVTSCVAFANRDLNLLAAKSSFLRMPGGGICFDYGVYYLTALVSLLGPVRRVAGISRNPYPVRKNTLPESPDYGNLMEYPNESQVSAILQFGSGITGTFHLNGDSNLEDQTGLIIFGTKGILKLASPNGFGGDVIFVPNTAGLQEESGKPQVLENLFDYADNSRGIGPADQARAIRRGGKPRADMELAYHVMEVLCGIMESSEKSAFVNIKSGCDRPEPMPGNC